MDKQSLIDAIKRSGGKQNPLAEVDSLWPKIDLLRQTGRYGLLLSQLSKANDKSNFLALVLEANFAYQFESQRLQLAYEVKQAARHKSSIDFLGITSAGDKVYFELRLLQQTKSIADSIDNQLQKSQVSQVVLGAQDEQDEVVRIQNTILGKVQDKDGNPTKFFSTDSSAINIVVVDASASLLGTATFMTTCLPHKAIPASKTSIEDRSSGCSKMTSPSIRSASMTWLPSTHISRKPCTVFCSYLGKLVAACLPIGLSNI